MRWQGVFRDRWLPTQAAGPRATSRVVTDAMLGSTAGPVNYTETATVAGAGAVVASDSFRVIEVGAVAGAGAVVAAWVASFVDAGTVAGDGAVVAVDVSSVAAAPSVLLVLPSTVNRRHSGVSARGGRRWVG